MLGSLKNFLRHRWHYAKGVVKIGDVPHLEPDGLVVFEAALAACTSYLEFGSGGSSIAAARSGKPFVSVESDRAYLRLVQRRAAEVAPGHKGRFLHADIGFVNGWGYPAFSKPTPGRVARWRRYSSRPWPTLSGHPPDLILIDGRFRVACALAVVQHAEGTTWRMLVDDYDDRPHYRAIEEFASLIAMHGRMAEFAPRPFDRERLLTVRNSFEADFQ